MESTPNSNKHQMKNGDVHYLLFITFSLAMVLTSSRPAISGTNPRSMTSALSSPVLVHPLNYSALGASSGDSLKWTDVAGAKSYLLQVSTDSTFKTKDLTVIDSAVAGTSFVLPTIKPQTIFYWRVSAADSVDTSGWSTRWTFTTGTPSAPIPTAPPTGSSYRPSPIELGWSSAAYADSFRVQLAVYNGDYLFSAQDIVVDTLVSSDTIEIPNLQLAQTYYWHVSARNENGSGPWSATQTFSTSGLPTITLVAPARLDKVSPPNVTCSWLTTRGAVAYEFQLSLDAYFNSPPLIDTVTEGTSVLANILVAGKDYYWRVRAKSNVNGVWGSWYSSEFYTYPAAPVLLAPANRTEVRAVNATLRWKGVAGASYYQIQLAHDSSFKSIVIDSTTLSAVDSVAIDTLAPNSELFWHVRGGSNSNGWSSYSSTWAFSTTSLPPVSPTLASPQDSSVISPLGVVLFWRAVPGADLYLVQLSTDSTFKSVYLNDSAVAADSLSVGTLKTAATYFWRVGAHSNTAGWGKVSKFHRFSTTPYILPAPELMGPADSSSNLPTSLMLHWGIVSRALVYHVQISPRLGFDTLTVNDSTVSSDSVSVQHLVRGFRYYWRVQAGLGGGRWSPYSTMWTFTAEPWTQATTLTVNSSVAFPVHSDISQFKPTDYKLVGFPGVGGLTMAKVFGGTPEKDWQAYWDDGADSNYFVKYNQSDTFDVGSGRAFWLIHNGPLQVNTTVTAIPLDSLGQVEIPLHGGWNIITDPFAVDVPWDTVQVINHISEPIWSFDGSFGLSASLSTYQGYYYFNADSLASLKIPYMEAQSAPSVSRQFVGTASADSSWTIHVMLTSAGAIDSSLWFGASRSAKSGFNRLDIHKPRSLGSNVSIYFRHPNWNPDFESFASEIHPLFADSSEWTVEADAIPGKEAVMKFSSINQLPAGFDVYLLNADNGAWVNLRKTQAYSFIPKNRTTSFKVLVGKTGFLDGVIGKSGVRSFRLDANYPNPFNPTTVITYQLATDSRVSLKVYDILGREVATLVAGEQIAGTHTVQFNGARLASGVYFYRLVTGTHEATRKMVLLK